MRLAAARHLLGIRQLLGCDALIPQPSATCVTVLHNHTLSQFTKWDTGERLTRRSRITNMPTGTMTPCRKLTTFRRLFSRLSLPALRATRTVDVCLARLYALQVRILEFGRVFQPKTSQAIKPNMP